MPWKGELPPNQSFLQECLSNLWNSVMLDCFWVEHDHYEQRPPPVKASLYDNAMPVSYIMQHFPKALKSAYYVKYVKESEICAH